MKSIEVEDAAVASSGRPAVTLMENGVAHGAGVESLSVLNCCRLAEEIFVFAAVARNLEVAAELTKVGDDYLRCSAGPFLGVGSESAVAP